MSDPIIKAWADTLLHPLDRIPRVLRLPVLQHLIARLDPSNTPTRPYHRRRKKSVEANVSPEKR